MPVFISSDCPGCASRREWEWLPGRWRLMACGEASPFESRGRAASGASPANDKTRGFFQSMLKIGHALGNRIVFSQARSALDGGDCVRFRSGTIICGTQGFGWITPSTRMERCVFSGITRVSNGGVCLPRDRSGLPIGHPSKAGGARSARPTLPMRLSLTRGICHAFA